MLAFGWFSVVAHAECGDRTALLDELEPLLLELANSAEAAPEDLAAAQRRIEHTDLLFKLRVTGGRLQREGDEAMKKQQRRRKTKSKRQ